MKWVGIKKIVFLLGGVAKQMVAKIYHACFRRGGENLKERKQGLLFNLEFVVHFVPILTLPDNVCIL
jgi:hypothetical protein